MNYHNITVNDMLNGEGLRSVLWVSGCEHGCKECQNPITWDVNGGLPFDEKAEKELFDSLRPDYISGITFSGGDPLHPQNRAEIFRLIKKVKEMYPDKTIWLYTGYLWEEICTLSGVENIDVLVDGEFVKELFDSQLHWKGSSNQRVIAVKESLKEGKAVLYKEKDYVCN